MEQETSNQLLAQGIQLAEAGDFNTAMIYLQRTAAQEKGPLVDSYLAYCSAQLKGPSKATAQVCQDNIARQRHNATHYLLLGRIMLLAGNRERAEKTFRLGLKAAPNPLIIEELKQLGLRSPVLFKGLDRQNILNRLLGKILSRLGLR